jgi:threonylcarbamoyladenosine tRNA methylthiotransferase MtaB
MTDITIFENKKIAFQTLGCKLNFAETSALGRQLSEIGFIKAKTNEEADVVIINTCSVTDTADKKGRQMIHRMIKKHPNAYIVVTGCYAQLKPEEIANIEGVDLVLGANEKVILPQFLENLAKKQHGEYHVVRTAQIRNFRPECSADDRTRHFLKVQDGCDYYCTYCTIPFARGRSRNASIAETIKVAQKAITDGAKEIVLTGVNTGDFGRSTGETFFELIQALDNLNGDIRYRISSIEPNLLTDEIINFVANSQHFAPHFHIPLQSGSDTLLKLMHRRYDTALFAYKINRIKQIMPNAFIGVDVMVGGKYKGAYGFSGMKDEIKSLKWMDNGEDLKFIQGNGMLCFDATGYEYGKSLVVRVAKAEIE